MTQTTYHPKTTQLRSFFDAVPAFVAGTDTPRNYLERCVERIEALEPEIKAFVTLNIANCRQAADESTTRYKAGRPLSPIDGMPVGIKDLYETFDMPTQMGSPIFRGWQTKRDGAAVYALRKSGALIVGKTVTTEFGFYNPGPTRNPFDTSRTPGGSSSGSAAALGAGMVPVAIGSQVVGSLIRPASYCGHIGFKPSVGAINRQGGHSGLSQACIGLHTGNFQDLWIATRQICNIVGGDPGHPGLQWKGDLPTAEKPTRTVAIKTAGWDDVTPAAVEQFHAALGALRQQGIEVADTTNDPEITAFENLLRDARGITHTICGYELRWPLTHYRDRGGELSEDLGQRLLHWEHLTADEYREAIEKRLELRRRHAQIAAGGRPLLALSAAGCAPQGMATGDPSFAAPASLLGAPALSLPVLQMEGMPLGLQVIGAINEDERLIRQSQWLQEAVLAAGLS